jgi:uncharacterized membrane protein
MYDIYKLIHLAAGILWMGGIGFMLLALRPAAMAVLPPPQRLALMAAAMRRFFGVVGVSIAALLASGTPMYTTMFRATREASGQGSVPLGWNLMLGLGLLMMLVFGHLFFVGYARFKRAVAASDWPLAGKAAQLINRLVILNFVLGWLAIVCVRLVH